MNRYINCILPLLLVLCVNQISAQPLRADSSGVRLKEVVVSSFGVKPDKPFKERRLKIDSVDRAGSRSIGELLNEKTGIFVKSYGGNGVASLSFRGTGASHTKLYWNGLDLGSPSLGQVDFSLFPTDGFDEVNIRYGLASLVDGSGALGGSIRLGNSASWKKGFRGSATQEIGSFGRQRSSATVKWGNDKLQLVTGAYLYRADNNFDYVDITVPHAPIKKMTHNGLNNSGFFQQLYWKMNAKNKMSAKVWYNQVDRDLPAPITNAGISSEHMNDEMLNSVVEYNRAGKNSHLYINGGLSVAGNHYKNDGDSVNNNTDYRSWQSNVRYKRQLLRSKLLLEGGLRFKYDLVRSGGYNTDIEQLRFSSYLNTRYALGERWGITGLIRGQQIANNTVPVMGSLGAYWQTGADGTIKLNAARNYRYPSLNDLYWKPGGNPALQPEKSWNIETGYRKTWSGSVLDFDVEATLFSSYVDNWIIWTPQSSNWAPQNVRKVHNRGAEVELDGHYQAGPWNLSAMLSYSFTSSSNESYYVNNEAAVDQQLIYVPHHKGVANVSATYRQFHISYSQRYTGRYYVSTDNTSFMPAYGLADASLGYRWAAGEGKHIIYTEFSVRNLFDWNYQVIPYRPGAGRSFSLKIGYRFR